MLRYAQICSDIPETMNECPGYAQIQCMCAPDTLRDAQIQCMSVSESLRELRERGLCLAGLSNC